MKASDVVTDNLVSLSIDDTVAKAINVMYQNKINQIPIINRDTGKYAGMIFAKEFLNISAMPDSKLKSFVTNTAVLNGEDSVEKCTKMVITSGNRALPIVANERLSGIVTDTDLVVTSDPGHAIIDQVMSGAVVIESDNTVGNALSKMRRYNISRLPVISANGVLIGIINILDITKLIATPRDRASKSPGIGTMATIRDIKIKEIMRRPISVETGTRLNSIIENFRTNDEIVVIGNKRPIGIVTPKDVLESILPKQSEISIHIAHIEDQDARREIASEMTAFLKKIRNRVENIQNVIVYVDKHKTSKYSIRARLLTGKDIIDAKAVGYDAMTACRKTISKLDRRIRSEHSQKIRDRQHRSSARNIF
jgi:CBS domain-containing protein/ribosome-associated translation inhibitor RaiA